MGGHENLPWERWDHWAGPLRQREQPPKPTSTFVHNLYTLYTICIHGTTTASNLVTVVKDYIVRLTIQYVWSNIRVTLQRSLLDQLCNDHISHVAYAMSSSRKSM